MPLSIVPLNDEFRSVSIAEIMQNTRVRNAFDFIDLSAAEFTAEHIRICEIPAPPFKEGERGQYFIRRFTELGLTNVHTDSEGNVIGLYRGRTDNPLTVLSAHLDTVFPEGTDVSVRRTGSRLCAPGIADDVAGLAALIALIQTLNAAKIETLGTIAFVATVGEEGEGDLRGVRYLFNKGALAEKISNFVSFDGTNISAITHKALGSRRYRVTLEGPGGHSWGDFGVVNPVHALGRAVARMAEYRAPSSPRTTFNVGRIEGGESVNVIPAFASIDIDLRSTSQSELFRIENYFLNAVKLAIADEIKASLNHSAKLKSTVSLIGDRPSGEISENAPIVRYAVESSRALGITCVLNTASTDANIPISLGIPSVTLGTGGRSGDSHRLSEWYDPMGRELGYKRALVFALALSGIEN